jgi:hypothetical protein
VSVAIAEEIIFRGLLLPRFVERYGLPQGILLVGLIWAAMHFASDLHYGSSLTEVLYQLTNRIFFLRDLQLCFVVDDPSRRFDRFCSSCALGVEHAQYHPAGRVPIFAGEREIHSLLLGVIGYLLLRFWPVTEKPPASSAIQDAAPVLAS